MQIEPIDQMKVISDLGKLQDVIQRVVDREGTLMDYEAFFPYFLELFGKRVFFEIQMSKSFWMDMVSSICIFLTPSS